MKERIFMDVPQVRELADKLGNYCEIQTEKLNKYNSAVKELVGFMIVRLLFTLLGIPRRMTAI